jgi:dTDP-L-rhamnose 4-epimerase
VRGRSVLVTGGAGFVGSHLVDRLVARGDRVRVMDNLDAQVHGPRAGRPRWLAPEAELVVGDVRDRDHVTRAVRGAELIFHLAASVGVGQSMYRVADYTATNSLGTANLLQSLIDGAAQPERLIVASSMSIYGEGRYARSDGSDAGVVRREPACLAAHEWEPRDDDGSPLVARPTDEEKPLDPSSVYALTKADQERMSLQVGAAYEIPTVALRFFNIYGPRQSLANPYTGVAAIFSSRLLNGNAPLIFEDGRQSRDFVSVHDVVDALLLAAERESAVGRAINVGSGSAVTVREIAATLAQVLGCEIEAEVTGRYRVGDIRHCFADIERARDLLGYAPRIGLERGMRELVAWLRTQDRPVDSVGRHAAELAARGLTV